MHPTNKAPPRLGQWSGWVVGGVGGDSIGGQVNGWLGRWVGQPSAQRGHVVQLALGGVVSRRRVGGGRVVVVPRPETLRLRRWSGCVGGCVGVGHSTGG